MSILTYNYFRQLTAVSAQLLYTTDDSSLKCRKKVRSSSKCCCCCPYLVPPSLEHEQQLDWNLLFLELCQFHDASICICFV
eukprot:06731.XXX_101131_101373_1 [CDS] Oithona nana genome sequencing.